MTGQTSESRGGLREPVLPIAAIVDGGDQALMARIVARDSTALAALYDRHSRLLFGVACRMLQNRGDAEEVLQEVFLVAWTRASTYNRVLGSPVAWLVRITRNRAIDRLRTCRATSRVEARFDAPAPAPSPESAMERTESQRRVTGALCALSPEQRDLIQTAYFEGLSQSELAARFRLPLGTVKTRIRAGMKILREALDSAQRPVGGAMASIS